MKDHFLPGIVPPAPTVMVSQAFQIETDPEFDTVPDPSDIQGTLDWWDAYRAQKHAAFDANGARTLDTMQPLDDGTPVGMIPGSAFRKFIKIDEFPFPQGEADAATP